MSLSFFSLFSKYGSSNNNKKIQKFFFDNFSVIHLLIMTRWDKFHGTSSPLNNNVLHNVKLVLLLKKNIMKSYIDVIANIDNQKSFILFLLSFIYYHY